MSKSEDSKDLQRAIELLREAVVWAPRAMQREKPRKHIGDLGDRIDEFLSDRGEDHACRKDERKEIAGN